MRLAAGVAILLAPLAVSMPDQIMVLAWLVGIALIGTGIEEER